MRIEPNTVKVLRTDAPWWEKSIFHLREGNVGLILSLYALVSGSGALAGYVLGQGSIGGFILFMGLASLGGAALWSVISLTTLEDIRRRVQELDDDAS